MMFRKATGASDHWFWDVRAGDRPQPVGQGHQQSKGILQFSSKKVQPSYFFINMYINPKLPLPPPKKKQLRILCCRRYFDKLIKKQNTCNTWKFTRTGLFSRVIPFLRILLQKWTRNHMNKFKNGLIFFHATALLGTKINNYF